MQLHRNRSLIFGIQTGATILLLASCTIESNEQDDVNFTCLKHCTLQLEPVCGIPMNKLEKPISFANQCVMDNFNCIRGKGEYKLLGTGTCNKLMDPTHQFKSSSSVSE